jgi:hypothetical protein
MCAKSLKGNRALKGALQKNEKQKDEKNEKKNM